MTTATIAAMIEKTAEFLAVVQPFINEKGPR